MRTWLVLAAVLIVAAAAAADALRGGLRDRDVNATAPTTERRIVPPGVPSGFMGTVFYSDPADGCRLRSLRLVGFTEAQPPNYSRCRFSLSPDGTRAAPGAAAWSPLGGVVAVPGDDEFGLESGPGQTIVVRSKACVAIEAMEGTDATIRRAGELAKGKLTVIKVAKPDQDMRFDVPVVGLPTIETMIRSGATCLCLTPNKTLIFDRSEMLKLADDNKICVVAANPKQISQNPRI